MQYCLVELAVVTEIQKITSQSELKSFLPCFRSQVHITKMSFMEFQQEIENRNALPSYMYIYNKRINVSYNFFR